MTFIKLFIDNNIVVFLLFLILGFAAMEIISYAVHRFLFHGVLWKIHQTHHRPHKFFLELNDVFSLFFALVSIGLILSKNEIALPIGLGIALYGFVYFITHDLFTHRRFWAFNSENKILRVIRAAHQRHHQSSEKLGLEPFGLFLFDYPKFRAKIAAVRNRHGG